MRVSCEVAEMISGAWGLAARDGRAQWAFWPTLTLREPSRRSKYPDLRLVERPRARRASRPGTNDELRRGPALRSRLTRQSFCAFRVLQPLLNCDTLRT